MSETLSFKEAKQRYLKTLQQYVPIVARVHGNNHPEFHHVRSVFDELVRIVQEAGTKRPELHDQFARLREITGAYRVPGDVCETFEAVYRMLAELDAAYQA
jgi:regulator of cell morphogenesis and NO signaling